MSRRQRRRVAWGVLAVSVAILLWSCEAVAQADVTQAPLTMGNLFAFIAAAGSLFTAGGTVVYLRVKVDSHDRKIEAMDRLQAKLQTLVTRLETNMEWIMEHVGTSPQPRG